MRDRIVLCGCLGAHEGRWASPTGHEVGVRILYLQPGERIRVELDNQSLQFTDPGTHWTDALAHSSRYRVCKEVDRNVSAPSPTIVEVLLHG